MGPIVFPVTFVDGAGAELAEARTVSLVIFKASLVDIAIFEDYLALTVSLLLGAISNILAWVLHLDLSQIKKAILNKVQPLFWNNFD